MQRIAGEMNVSETAFLTRPLDPTAAAYRLRWVSPAREVAFCGHATVATTHVLVERGRAGEGRLAFETLGGPLPVVGEREGDAVMIWREPALPQCTPHRRVLRDLLDCLGLEACADWALAVVTSDADLLLPVSDLATLRALTPDMRALGVLARAAELRGVCTVALEGHDPGSRTHARFFAPHYGIA